MTRVAAGQWPPKTAGDTFLLQAINGDHRTAFGWRYCLNTVELRNCLWVAQRLQRCGSGCQNDRL